MYSLRVAFVMCAILPLTQIGWTSDETYRCSDGTFTNRVERQCPPYESKGIVRVQGLSAAGAKSFAEVKPSGETIRPPAARR
jgi:hypothetical protein